VGSLASVAGSLATAGILLATVFLRLARVSSDWQRCVSFCVVALLFFWSEVHVRQLIIYCLF
jgi:hypothetical protein